MSLTIPFSFTGGPGNKAKASEINANFQSVANKFTEGAGGITDGDISTSAAIKGAKLSNVLGNRVPFDRLEPDAVDKDALRDDVAAGHPTAAVNTANHVKAGILLDEHFAALTLTGSKVAATTLGEDKLKLVIDTVNMLGLVTGAGYGTGALFEGAVTYDSGRPRATHDLVGIFVRDLAGTAVRPILSVTPDTSGANWKAAVRALSVTNLGLVSGSLVFVSIAKV